MFSDRPALTKSQIDDIDERALQLVAIAHGDGDTNDVARLTSKLDRAGLIGLAIACAALVDPDRTVDELLAWLPDPGANEGWTEQELRTAHAEHRRGNRTPRVVLGNRIYNRTRMQRVRATKGRAA